MLEVERGAASDRCNAPRVSGWRTAAMQLALQLRRGPTEVLRCCTPLHHVAWRCNLNCVPRCSYSQRLALFGSSTGGALQLSPAIAGARQPSARLKHQLVLQRRRRTLQRRATCRGTGTARYGDAVYHCLVTATTVGYGDLFILSDSGDPTYSRPALARSHLGRHSPQQRRGAFACTFACNREPSALPMPEWSGLRRIPFTLVNRQLRAPPSWAHPVVGSACGARSQHGMEASQRGLRVQRTARLRVCLFALA